MIAELHDGRRLEFPDGTDPSVIQATVKRVLKADIAAKIDADQISQGARNFNEGASFVDNFNAGAGKAITDLGRGVGQFFGAVSRDDVKESRRLEAPLMKTGGGIAGNLATNALMVAPSVALPGAATISGAAALGATFGLMQPSESTAETAMNTGLGAAGGAAGQWVANKAGAVVQGHTKAAASKVQQGAQKTQAAQAAHDAGYVIPPEDLGGGVVTKAVSGLSGKIKTAQVASERNQAVTNSLARQALGVADDVPLSTDTLKAIRDQAGQAYEAVKQTGMITPQANYAAELDKIVHPYKVASAGFPNGKPSPVVELVDSLRSPAFTAEAAVEKVKALRTAADDAFRTGNTDIGRAARKAAGVLEGAIEDHVKVIGLPDLLANLQAARRTIAQTYTVEKALNPTTGDVSAQALAGLLKRGKPLQGELRTIAEAGLAFPKATQALKESPKALSPLDWAVAGSGLLSGHPAGAVGLLARPGLRNALLSDPVQAQAVANMGKQATPNMLASMLANPQLTRTAGVLSGPAAGNALAAYVQQQQALQP